MKTSRKNSHIHSKNLSCHLPKLLLIEKITSVFKISESLMEKQVFFFDKYGKVSIWK